MAMTRLNNRPRILVAGCGALGGRIACRLTANADVWGLRRTPTAVPDGVTPVAVDLLDRPALSAAVPHGMDIVLYCLTPSSYDDDGYRQAYVEGLDNLLTTLDRSRLQRVFFISSTSVYSQDDDSLVDENSETRPDRFSGQRILEGEQVALNSGIPATILRLSGIYGPGRRRFLEAVQAGQMNPASPGPYSNRIHEEDAVRACAHLVHRCLSGQPVSDCYLITDCEPVRLDDVVNWVRNQIPCQPPVSEARTGGRAGSKRCRNERLLKTGFHFRYPDFRAGYGEMIEDQRHR